MFGMDDKLTFYFLACTLLIGFHLWIWKRFSKIARQRDAATAEMGFLQKKMAQLQAQALHDYLTGLPNRALLADRIRQALAKATRERSSFLIFFLDLDGFKPVNDMYGHEVGDRLLVDIGKRLQSVIREEDTVARIGGDEFVILAAVSSSADGIFIVRKIEEAMSRPFVVGDYSIHVTASIGQSAFPEDGNSLEELLWKADEAMYANKHSGRVRRYGGGAAAGDDGNSSVECESAAGR